MNDREAAELLGGIDAPRPMPRDLVDAVLADLTDPVTRMSDEARPLPADLRQRLEASLLGARPMPLPGRVRHRIEQRLLARDRSVSRVGAAAAVVLLVVGILAAVTNGGGGGDPAEVATPRTTVLRPSAGGTPPTAAPISGSGGGSAHGGGSASGSASAPPPPFTEGGQATADAGSAATPATGVAPGGTGPIVVALTGAGSRAQVGIRAYFDLVNAAGGIYGRPIEVDGPDHTRSVASVNIGEEGLTTTPAGVVFETLHAEEARLAGPVVSLASAVEHQARIAAAAASPEEGGSSVIYVGQREPWLTVVPDAIEAVLRGRGVASVRVAFDNRAPAAAASGDVIFLSLPSGDVRGWLDVYSGARPARGTWGVGSVWDDDLAAAGAEVGLRAVSPYTRVGGDEEAELIARGGGLSAPIVHGWVTGKAIARLLYESGGAVLTEASLDSLVGWDSGWAPPFAVRDATRSRTPDGIVLVADGTRFVPSGGFLTDR